MYAALGVITPDLDGMRFALLLTKVPAFGDLYPPQVCRTTVRPCCHLFLRQQTWQENSIFLNTNFVVVAGVQMWESR
jgi:hypothetical protein